MSFVAGEIAVWMVLAFVLGLAVGWLAHARRGAGGRGTGGRSGGRTARRRAR